VSLAKRFPEEWHSAFSGLNPEKSNLANLDQEDVEVEVIPETSEEGNERKAEPIENEHFFEQSQGNEDSVKDEISHRGWKGPDGQ